MKICINENYRSRKNLAGENHLGINPKHKSHYVYLIVE